VCIRDRIWRDMKSQLSEFMSRDLKATWPHWPGAPHPTLERAIGMVYGCAGLVTVTLLARRVDPVARCRSARALL